MDRFFRLRKLVSILLRLSLLLGLIVVGALLGAAAWQVLVAGKVNDGTGTYNKADALLFFPAAGNGYEDTYYDAGYLGDFWTGSLNSANPAKGCILYLNGGEGRIDAASNDSDRYRGYSVRPVQDPAATYKAVSGVTFDVEKKEVVEGGNVQLSATVSPADATNKGVYWTSSDTTVAKVDALGKVTAVKAGTATITATTVDGTKTATCTVTVKGLPAGALKGEFSVSATKTVYFSKGNMYWDGDSFEFEANQYDSQSIWNTSHVSHFYWSKNASVAYAKEYSESGTTKTDVFFTNEEQETAKAGFTVNGVAGKYRTLSDDEWIYLVRNRTMTNGGSRYENLTSSGITIEGVTFDGIVLFPDDFTDQETWKTKYTTWEALNSAGLVFLPAAGYRSGSEFTFTTVYSGGYKIGYYWTSTPNSPSQGEPQANAEHFFYQAFNVGYTGRNKGCCIRLVTEASAAGDPGNGTEQYKNNSNPNWF